MAGDPLSIFALSGTREFGERVATAAGQVLAPLEERWFEDGEHKTRPLESVRNRDVFVIESLHGEETMSVNDKLCRLLFFIGALKDASAARVTAVVPYLCYARKDRKTKSRDPVTTRYIAQLFEAVGTDCIVTIDVHNLAAYQNAFRCNAEHLEARLLFAAEIAKMAGREKMMVVVSPDAGGAKRATALRDTLAAVCECDVPLAFLEKQRSGGIVSGEAVVGPIEGRIAVIIDDLISTGTTLVRAADACTARGATRVIAAATHGVFAGEADETLGGADALESILVTNTVRPIRLQSDRARRKLIVLDVAPLLGDAIRRIATS